MRAVIARSSLHRASKVAVSGVLLGLACSVAGPAAAEAQSTGSAACRGSAVRVTVGGAVTAEPVVANAPGTPCSTQRGSIAGVAPIAALDVTAPTADTRRVAGVVAASASVDGVTLGGPVAIGVGHVSVSQVRSCTAGGTTASGSSTVDGLVVAGIPVTIVGGRAIDQTIAGVRIRTNQVNGDTRQALVLDVGGIQVVLGEATASGEACGTASGSGSGSGTPATPPNGDEAGICPDGASYDVARDACVIVVPATPGALGATERTIVLGAPYEGPRGGTVVALSEARRLADAGRLPKSPCLSGAGPQYVVLGARGADRITGTNRADRIIARAGADRVDGGRGNDCIDGDEAGDTLTGGEGADRIFGAAGADHVNGGPGTDRISTGAGNDTINTGYGRDEVHAGAGRDSVNAATAGPAGTVFAGPGRDIVRINLNERRRVHGAEVVHVLR